LYRYPGPRLWRASRLFASKHHAQGDLYKNIARLHAEYGPTVRIAPSELSFSDPSLWNQIYNSRPQLAKSEFHFGQNNSPSGLPPAMITEGDTAHARIRRLVNPAFLNSGVYEVEPVLQHYSDLLVSKLEQQSQSQSQPSSGSETKGFQGIKPIEMGERFLWTLSDVIGKLAMGYEFNCLEQERMHPWPAFLLKVLKHSAFLNQFRRFHISPVKVLGPFLPQKMKEEQSMFFNTAKGAIKERLAREDVEAEADQKDRDGKNKAPSLNRSDIIGLMLREMKTSKKAREGSSAELPDRLSEPEITSNAILIVAGGAETTSTSLSATLYYLCKTPGVMKKLQDELRTEFATLEDITIKKTAELPYLKAVIDEAIRIFPVASYIAPRVVGKGGAWFGKNWVAEGVSLFVLQLSRSAPG
jgi:aspirochlorine biosynthesis cytochrome P450 monooxygenase